MPVRRDADGKLVHEPTRQVRQPKQTGGAPPRADPAGTGQRAVDVPNSRTKGTWAHDLLPTTPVGGGSGSSGGRHDVPITGRYDVPTTPVRKPSDPDGERTRVFRRRERPAGQDAAFDDPMDDPPVGWLVVVDGPGKGRVATLGTGVNSIGRDQSERVALDYGDMRISRTHHATITYDPRGRKFYVQHGGGKNLTYVGDEPVLAPRELPPLAQVQMGDTVLRFVPLCDAGFSWDDESDDD